MTAVLLGRACRERSRKPQPSTLRPALWILRFAARGRATPSCPRTVGGRPKSNSTEPRPYEYRTPQNSPSTSSLAPQPRMHRRLGLDFGAPPLCENCFEWTRNRQMQCNQEGKKFKRWGKENNARPDNSAMHLPLGAQDSSGMQSARPWKKSYVGPLVGYAIGAPRIIVHSTNYANSALRTVLRGMID